MDKLSNCQHCAKKKNARHVLRCTMSWGNDTTQRAPYLFASSKQIAHQGGEAWTATGHGQKGLDKQEKKIISILRIRNTRHRSWSKRGGEGGGSKKGGKKPASISQDSPRKYSPGGPHDERIQHQEVEDGREHGRQSHEQREPTLSDLQDKKMHQQIPSACHLPCISQSKRTSVF